MANPGPTSCCKNQCIKTASQEDGFLCGKKNRKKNLYLCEKWKV